MSKQMRKERREDSMFILLKSNTKPIKCILLMSMLMVLLITTAHAGHPWEDHGKLEVSENKRYLQHEDGTPFFWFGDTCWEASHHLPEILSVGFSLAVSVVSNFVPV